MQFCLLIRFGLRNSSTNFGVAILTKIPQFHGKIDEVCVSNLPRDENEIMDAFKNGFLPVSSQEKMTIV